MTGEHEILSCLYFSRYTLPFHSFESVDYFIDKQTGYAIAVMKTRMVEGSESIGVQKVLIQQRNEELK